MKKKLLDGSFLYVIISIVIGFIIGALLLLVIGVNPGVAYAKLFSGVFSKPKFITYSIVYAAPLIFTGLSVAFSFRTGIFNIGAEGQYVVGSLAAAVIGILIPMPKGIHAIVCILAAAAAGALWGFLVGLMKVKKGINEVLSYIMLNWIAFYLSNFVVNIKAIHTDQGAEATKNIQETASIKMPSAMAKLTGCTDVHWGIVLAVLAAILMWFIMTKTTFGYQLRAVGFSRTAAEYAGIRPMKLTVADLPFAKSRVSTALVTASSDGANYCTLAKVWIADKNTICIGKILPYKSLGNYTIHLNPRTRSAVSLPVFSMVP